MSITITIQRVHIELSRVQTWLFAVPRLRAMVGANALLGETLRVALPKLARETGRGWVLAPSREAYPCADASDPLKDHDDPAADAKDGILARDGGHLEVQFASGADTFADAAGQLLRSNVPGLRFRVSIDDEPRTKSQVHVSTELPVLAPCEWTGRGLASAIVEQGDERPAVSLDVAQRHKAAKRTEDGTAVDVASLLSDKTKLKTLQRAQELKELVGSGYLALIHADGNGVGSGAGKADCGRPTFFHRNRVLLRRAVQKAIDAHCPDTGRAPLIPLMLGGDDLLLVARAEIALPFVVTLCAELDALQKDSTDFKLTLGIGVVFAKHTIPVHRLHEVAEQLASSAKRRFRGLLKEGEANRSVVDWAVFSSAWVDDPEDVRRRDWLRGSGNELRVLSQRPVDALGQGLDSLQGLVRGAGQLTRAPRSQLRYLVDQLPRGHALSELAFAELPQEAKGPLAEAGITTPWRPAGTASITALLDLVEIAEIGRLGRNTERTDTEREAAHV
ncbi:MAG: Cas10/Cmr2 second palm domain-containing protein [Polyangiaceae bacterium]